MADDGCTADLLVALGFEPDLMLRVVRAGFATDQPERTFAAGKPVEGTRVQITDAGRRGPGCGDADDGRGKPQAGGSWVAWIGGA
jgi:hypothetical protein